MNAMACSMTYDANLSKVLRRDAVLKQFSLKLAAAGALVFSLAISQIATAQTASAPPLAAAPMSIPPAIARASALAAQQSPSARAAAAEQAAAQALRDGARFSWYPTATAQVKTGSAVSRGVTTVIDQPIYDFGKRSSDRDALDARLQSATKGVVVSQSDAAGRAARLVVALARIEAQLEVARSNLALHEKLLGFISQRAAGGVSTAADVSLAKSRAAAAQSVVLEQAESLALAKQQYVILTGQQAPASIGEFAAVPVLPWQGPALLDRVYANSPQLNQQRLDSEAIAADARSQRAGLYPVISLRAERDSSNNTTKGFYGGLNLSWQGDVALSAQDRVRATEERARAATLQMDRVRQSLAEAVSSAELSIQGAGRRLTLSQEQVGIANETLESFQSQFNLGRRTWTEVMNVLTDVLSSRQRVVDARYQAWDGWVQIVSLTGDLPRE
jgi:outer membrane protein, adhesin transport system